jgi:hypothetical protein
MSNNLVGKYHRLYVSNLHGHLDVRDDMLSFVLHNFEHQGHSVIKGNLDEKHNGQN